MKLQLQKKNLQKLQVNQYNSSALTFEDFLR